MLFKLKNVEYKLANQKILSKISFNINKGNHLLILGPSGSGKTTLLNLMTGLLRVSGGEVLFEDINFSSLLDKDLDDLRSKNFGLIFQKLHLINHLNVRQNIALAQNKFNSLDIEELIGDLGLSKKSNQMISNLSVGEAQRVAIARGIANKPKVIFADEPTSSLDDLNTQKVMELIFSQIKKTDSTLIVSTHDNRIKKYFSRLMEL